MRETCDIHAAIDDVARRLTAGEAPAGLRANVLAQIGDRRPRAWWHEPRVALAAAIVLVAAVGAAMMLRRVPEAAPGGPAVAAARPLVDLQPSAASPSPALVTSATGADASPTASSESELAWRARALPALILPDAIAFEEIQPDRLAIPLLEVAPIVMAPIAPPADVGGSR
jgi:hypothetical protein